MQDKAQKIHTKMVKWQKELEETFKLKMDRDFKEKTDFVTLTLSNMMKDIE